jgi:hypothetical protein
LPLPGNQAEGDAWPNHRRCNKDAAAADQKYPTFMVKQFAQGTQSSAQPIL